MRCQQVRLKLGGEAEYNLAHSTNVALDSRRLTMTMGKPSLGYYDRYYTADITSQTSRTHQKVFDRTASF